MVEGFLLGVIATCSYVAALCFLRFWRDTRDSLFLAFAASFAIEGTNRVFVLFVSQPNEGAAFTYLVRVLAFLLILAAILRKNYAREKPPSEKRDASES
jgi:uncharacterized membrane protein HdeD (DUF308 family)